MDKHWTVLESEDNVVHQEELGRGGYGEVHKVTIQFPEIAKLRYSFATPILNRPSHAR